MATTLLHVAEKGSVAKAIKTALLPAGAEERRRGRGPNFIWEFDGEAPGYGRVRHVVTSVSGHVMGMEFSGAYRSWHSCAPLDLFDCPVVRAVSPESEDLAAQLQVEARKAPVRRSPHERVRTRARAHCLATPPLAGRRALAGL